MHEEKADVARNIFEYYLAGASLGIWETIFPNYPRGAVEDMDECPILPVKVTHKVFRILTENIT